VRRLRSTNQDRILMTLYRGNKIAVFDPKTRSH